MTPRFEVLVEGGGEVCRGYAATKKKNKIQPAISSFSCNGCNLSFSSAKGCLLFKIIGNKQQDVIITALYHIKSFSVFITLYPELLSKRVFLHYSFPESISFKNHCT